jgi:hypothetical protein
MFKFDIILDLFAIFKNFTSFQVFFEDVWYEQQVHEIIE